MAGTIVIDPNIIIGVFIFLLFVNRIVNTNGGFKIVLWRLFGVRGFIRVERQADGSAIRGTFRWSKHVKGSVLQYYLTKNGKGWLVGKPEETVRVFGLPQFVYNYNDARPLPLEQVQTVEKEVEVEVKDADGTTTTQRQKRAIIVAGKPIDPLLIHAFATNKSIAEFNQFSDPNARKVRWGYMALVIGLIFVLAALNVYYSYLFGVNANCALHTKICP